MSAAKQDHELTVLITGAAGFVGSFLAEECLRHGWRVHGTARPNERTDNLSQALETTIHTTELSDFEAVQALVADVRPTYIFHLAAQASVQHAWQDPMGTLSNNIASQQHILSAARMHCPQARLLVVSSSEVYGRVDGNHPSVDESTALGPLDPYSVSKVTQEMLGLQHYLAFGMGVVRVRPFNHAGPRQRPGFVAADFARQIAQIEAGQSEPVMRVGNLAAVRDISDVRDVVRAYTLAIQHGEAGAVYNVASGQGVSMADLLALFIETSGISITVEVDPERLRPIDRPVIIGNAAQLRACTNWAPTIALGQTVRDTLNYWRAQVTP